MPNVFTSHGSKRWADQAMSRSQPEYRPILGGREVVSLPGVHSKILVPAAAGVAPDKLIVELKATQRSVQGTVPLAEIR